MFFMKALRYVGLLFVAFSFWGCKTKGLVVESVASKPVSASTIAKAQNDNIKSFVGSSIRGQAKYEDARNSQNVALDIRTKRDEVLSISVRVLGITMAKAHITPEGVQYYEKIDHTHFDGDFAALQRWLGLPLGFEHVQRLLFGQALMPINSNGVSLIQDDLHRLSQVTEFGQLHYAFEGKHYLLKEQHLNDVVQQRSLTVNYPSYQLTSKGYFPKNISIRAIQNNETITIQIELQQITFDEELNFPYKVPSGSKQIFLE
jgi:hypothetical protein